MADDIDAMLSARASADEDIDAMLAARASAPDERPPAAPPAQAGGDLPWYKRAAMGAGDPLTGAGQLMQHIVPDRAMNVARTAAASLASPFVSSETAEDIARPRSTEEFDAGVRSREGEYQGQRAAAGQKGLDWWRVGGTVANPVSWLAPESGGAGVLAGVASGAKAGLFQALMQPVTSDGSFILNKGIQEAIGGAVGGTLGGALAALRPVFAHARKVVGGLFGSADDASQAAAASKITDDTLKAAGADPAKVDQNLYSAIKQEIGDALKAGVDPDPRVMANRADAAALPVPIDLTRGQATRDAMQFSWEVNNAKLRDAGVPLAARLDAQNRALIENMNQLGAANAPSTFDASKTLIGHIEALDAALKGRVDAAYSAVRDSAGRPALMDQGVFQQRARAALEQGQLTEFIPETIKNQYNALAEGRLPLTVDTAQTLDRVWNAEQRAAKGSAKAAIGALRQALNDAPVTDALGEQSMAAYKAARQLAAQRFGLIESSPAYKAVTEGVEPDKFFQKYVQGANVSELAQLKQLVGPENTQLLQRTLVGNLKKIALNRASDENGVFSQSAYNRVLQDPVQGPRLQELFKDAPETLGHLYRIGRVAENVQAFPKGHSVNTSNTAPTAANMIRDVAMSEAGASVTRAVPIVGRVLDVADKRAVAKAVDESLSAGVTRAPLKPAAPSPQVRRLSDLLVKAGAAGSVAAAREDEE